MNPIENVMYSLKGWFKAPMASLSKVLSYQTQYRMDAMAFFFGKLRKQCKQTVTGISSASKAHLQMATPLTLPTAVQL